MVDEVRPLRGRSDALADSTRIAFIGHDTYCAGVARALAPWWISIDKKSNPRQAPPVWPSSLKLDFLGKDITARVAKNWEPIAKQIQLGVEAHEFIQRFKPDALVVWVDEYPVYRGAVIAANELGIPTIEICHGAFYLPKHGHWAAKKYTKWQLGSRNYCDWHQMMGCSGQAIEVGSVEADPYVTTDGLALKTAARTELRLPSAAPVVTFLTDATFERTAWQDKGTAYWTADYFFRAFVALRATLAAQLVVKVHPYERVSVREYEKILREDYGLTEDYAVLDAPLVTAIGAADLVVGRPSSAMAAALSLGIPCLVLATEPFIPQHMIEGKGLMLASTPSEIVEKLYMFFLDYGLARRLIAETEAGRAYYAGNGNAARLAADAIIRIIRKEEV